MADKNLSSLTAAAQLDDADLLVVEQQGEAKSLAGAKLREYVEGAVEPIAERAEEAAENAAQNASDLVVATLEHYRDAAQLAATTAGQHSQEAQQAAADAKLAADSLDWEGLMNMVAGKVDNWYQDPDTHYVYLTSNGEPVGDPLLIVGTGGGGGGGEQNNAVLTFKNTSGWIYKTVSKGAELVVTLEWSSIEDELATGDGVLRVTVNGTQKYLSSVKQGTIELDIGSMLSAGSNAVKFNITDTYGNSRTVSINVTAVALELTSPFDATVAYTGGFAFPYVPTGSATKTVYFEMDGSNIGTATVTASGRQQTFNVPAQTHGAHILECWFEATIEGETVESNKLRYAVICLEEGNKTPVIATDFNLATAEQYDTIIIPYIVYDPASLTSTVTLSDGTKTTTLENVDRTKQAWSYRPENEGALTLSIATIGADTTAGTPLMATVNISLTITPTTIDVEAETENLSLYLTSYGRNNNEANPGEWKYGAVSAELTGFNYTSDGWQLDEDGATVLRVSGDARVNIPVELFKTDFRTSGKTIEVKFATRDVLNYDAPIITCWSGDRGLQITAQKALLKSEQSEISTQYKEDEKVHLAFVVEKKSAHRLLMIYINGILSGVVQYPDDDDFSQNSPVGISIGSNDTTADIYCIRVYDNDLTRYQVLDNWNAEMQLAADKADTWRHNDIFDDYGQIVIDKLPADLPYLVLEGAALPTYKGNKLSISGRYVDPVNARKSFTFKDAEIDVQGTSSAGYERKNYIIDFQNGFIIDGTTVATYVLGENNLPASIYTFKADVASSEGANNVELVKLYNDVSPRRTPPQQENSLVRQGIDGYPCVIFHDAGDGAVFIGKYNFNHDKKSDVFGFAPGSESWETKNNTSNRALWKDPDFSGTDWQNDFEARYPKDNTDVTRLSALAAWIASTDRDAVTSEADKAARLQKFKDEIEEWFDLDGTLFYYLFTELFLLADSRTKNSFPTKYDDNPWDWLPYDMDTALGINNEGKLAFGYELEDTDLVNGAQVYTGQRSVMWNNVRDAFPEKLMEMYQKLRSDNLLSYDIVNTRFEDHQSKWPEAIFNEDAYYKYLAPLFEKNNGSYLGMLQGSKAEQRKWWLYNRFRYIDSKYNAGDALTDFITLRGYAKGDITVTPYADIYATVKYGSYLVQERALRGGSYVLECPVDDLDDTEIYIYSASQIAELGDLSDLMVGYAEFAAGTKLKSLKLGDSADTYSNPNLTQLYAGNNVLLRTLDVRNCPNLGNTAVDVNATPSVNLSGCTNIEHIYFDNTAVTGVTLPNGGIIKSLHLPETITNLTIRNQTAITDFSMPSYANISTLRIENVSTAVPVRDIFAALPNNSRVRLIGFDWTFDTAADILSFYNRLDLMRGLNESGGNEDKAQMSGTVRVENITGAQLSEMQSRYPDIKVVYAHITSNLYFYNDTGTTLLYTASVADGGDGTYGGSTPTKASTAQYNYSFAGWSLTNGGSVNANALKAVTSDRNVYAAFTATTRTYTVYWYNGSTLLETDYNVPYGTVPTYNGSTPVDGTNGLAFLGWTPTVAAITGDTTYKAKFQSPVEVVEITESWATVLSNIVKNRHTSKYKVGNYIPIDLGAEGVVNMQIAAMDTDVLADGTGTAPVTFIAKELLTTKTSMHSSGYANWGTSEMRTYLANTIKPLVPASVRNRLAVVSKTQASYDTSANYLGKITTEDELWIPSGSEVYTSNGAYTALYSDNTSRIKNVVGSTDAATWWLRDATQGNYYTISTTGARSSNAGYVSYGVALSFCVGVKEITDTWDQIIAACNDGTYKDKYQIGDWKAIDLGTQGVVRMQIAAFDRDTLADGSGTAAITWLAQNRLATTMSGRSYPVWSDSADRTYLTSTILPLFPANISGAIQSVQKKHLRQHSGGSSTEGVYEVETTTDSLWLPSVAEVGIGVQTSGWSTHYAQTGEPLDLFYSENCTRVRDGAYSLRDAAAFYPAGSVMVTPDGDWDNNSGDVGMLIGFCTGKTPDPWDAVFASIDAGTYKTDYAIGDTIPFYMGEEVMGGDGIVHMQIAAFDADDLADGSGKAAVSLVAKNLTAQRYLWNPKGTYSPEGNYPDGVGVIGGWEKSSIRATCRDVLWPLIPKNIRDKVVEVAKTHSAADNSGEAYNQTTQDTIWLPSREEVNGLYSQLFPSQASRVKTYYHDAERPEKAGAWWLRNRLSSWWRADVVEDDGNFGGSMSYTEATVVVGFCLGKSK